ncbi:hypothetical protein KIW84_061125 [Lathyrus oleraceus]|uniref:Uncharacterized protein n=1 Tax=Pisum sativum TaxID=3888 RepID=A0A9D4W390_PEA|nr:hypothetical protein KIW84_061125 [Pisum sativum]
MDDQVVDTKPLKDYVIPTEEEPHCSIVPPLILENNFKLKLSLIGTLQQNQFTGLPSEKPKLHLSIFIDNCGTVKANDIDQNVSKKAIPTDPKKSNLELLMEKFAVMQTRENYEIRNQNLLTNETLRKLTTNANNVATHNQMLHNNNLLLSSLQEHLHGNPRKILRGT